MTKLAKRLTKRQDQKLDEMIAAHYYKMAEGLQINIMDIGKLYQLAKHEHIANGVPLDQAVQLSVDKYCRPAT